jgi:RimJ/RimL family protein N-acetyltransferase
MIVPVLETSRLLLRPFEMGDASELVRLAGAREIAANTLRIPHPYTRDHAEGFIQSCRANAQEGNSAVFAVLLRESRQLCGATGLEIDWVHRRAELGYWIGVPYWGRGYATEAASALLGFGFGELHLHRIFAYHFANNPASGRVLEKIGMRHEGCLRQHVTKWGEFVDLVAYGMLEADFAPRKADRSTSVSTRA